MLKRQHFCSQRHVSVQFVGRRKIGRRRWNNFSPGCFNPGRGVSCSLLTPEGVYSAELYAFSVKNGFNGGPQGCCRLPPGLELANAIGVRDSLETAPVSIPAHILTTHYSSCMCRWSFSFHFSLTQIAGQKNSSLGSSRFHNGAIAAGLPVGQPNAGV